MCIITSLSPNGPPLKSCPFAENLPVIDRQKRDLAVAVLRQFLDGKLTNDEFFGQFPRDKRDPALRGVFEFAWLFYDDLKTHKLVGKHALSPQAKRELLSLAYYS